MRDLFTKATDISVIAGEPSYSYTCRSRNGAFAITREYVKDHITKL